MNVINSAFAVMIVRMTVTSDQTCLQLVVLNLMERLTQALLIEGCVMGWRVTSDETVDLITDPVGVQVFDLVVVEVAAASMLNVGALTSAALAVGWY